MIGSLASALRSDKAVAIQTLNLLYSVLRQPLQVSSLPSHAGKHPWSTATLFHPVSNVNKKVVRITKIMNKVFRKPDDYNHVQAERYDTCNHA